MPALRPKGQGVRCGCAGVISLRCREISRELKKIRPQYGAAGVGAHRYIKAFCENARRRGAGNAAASDYEGDRDQDNGEAVGCHGSQLHLTLSCPPAAPADCECNRIG
jgi:hypothetical protein